VTGAIVGARRPGQIAGVAWAADFRLDAGERAEIDRVLSIQKAALAARDSRRPPLMEGLHKCRT
jgi:hypothetical protein